MDGKDFHRLDDYISMEEREHLLNGLHRYLIWVGEKVPEEMEVEGENIKLHELIWRCVHKKDLSDQEKSHLMELVSMLESKAKQDEEILLRANLTREEAKRLYNEIAGLIRAIMDLRECESGKTRFKEPGEETKKKIDDAKRWMGFLKNIGKKNTL